MGNEKLLWLYITVFPSNTIHYNLAVQGYVIISSKRVLLLHALWTNETFSNSYQ